MANEHQLSEGSLRMIMKGAQLENPIMQILGSKRIASGSSDKERFRLLLSDGKYAVSFAMLTTQINEKDTNPDLTDNSIIKISRYTTSVISNSGKANKRVLIILDMETIVPGTHLSKIGDPQQLPENDQDYSPQKEVKTSSVTAPLAKTNSVTSVSRNILDASLQHQLTQPISSLSPYQNKWVIKARVTNKSNVRTWSNSRGEGKLFSIDLLDESGEIKATIFRDLVDKFYDLIEIDKVYYISKCQLKLVNKQFNNLKNDYEMTFTNDTIVTECHESDGNIPQTHYDFVPINKVANAEIGTIIELRSTDDVQQPGNLQLESDNF